MYCISVTRTRQITQFDQSITQSLGLLDLVRIEVKSIMIASKVTNERFVRLYVCTLIPSFPRPDPFACLLFHFPPITFANASWRSKVPAVSVNSSGAAEEGGARTIVSAYLTFISISQLLPCQQQPPQHQSPTWPGSQPTPPSQRASCSALPASADAWAG